MEAGAGDQHLDAIKVSARHEYMPASRPTMAACLVEHDLYRNDRQWTAAMSFVDTNEPPSRNLAMEAPALMVINLTRDEPERHRAACCVESRIVSHDKQCCWCDWWSTVCGKHRSRHCSGKDWIVVLRRYVVTHIRTLSSGTLIEQQ